MGGGDPERRSIARREQRFFIGCAAVPNWADRVDHVLGPESISASYLGIAGFATMKLAAFSQQFGAGGAMNRAVDTATAKQRAIGCIHDCINGKGRDVGDQDIQPSRANLRAEVSRHQVSVIRYQASGIR